MQRAISILNGFGLHESDDINPHEYDHPFFGQFFLAGLLAIIGYPDLYSINNPSSTIEIDNSIKILYFVPRILMGLLAVVDTYLVYKIAEYRYNNKTIAFIAAVLFAVMPITWILRKIFLESILLPFLLLSILFALYSSNKDSIIHFKSKAANRNVFINKIKNQGTIFLVLLSGIFLGLAIFTKVPAFTMTPLLYMDTTPLVWHIFLAFVQKAIAICECYYFFFYSAIMFFRIQENQLLHLSMFFHDNL
jgi:Dolichyl-phosphate-mannose-protein mannosyltransferase